MPLRRVDALRPPSAPRRAFSWLVTKRPFLVLSRYVSWKLDPILLRVTGGRFATTLMIPTGVLETRGARTGARRRNAVVYWHDGESVIIAASQAGGPRHPAWYHNAIADPSVRFGDEPMRAAEVGDVAERDRLWQMGDRVFPAFATYRERAAATGRTIPLLRLRPVGAAGESASL